MSMKNTTQRNVTKIGRSVMIPNNSVGKHGEGMGVVAVKLTCPLDADTAPAVGVVYENQFAAVGVGFFNGWEFPFLGTKDFRFRLSVSGGYVNEERANKKRPTPPLGGRTGGGKKSGGS